MIPPPYNSIFTSWVQKKFLYEKSAQLLYNGLSLKIWKICSTKVGNELILRSRDSTRRDATSVVWAHFGLRSFEVATRHDATRLRSYELISDFGRSKSRLDTTRRDFGRMSSFRSNELIRPKLCMLVEQINVNFQSRPGKVKSHENSHKKTSRAQNA